jgi:hypothetical protein
MYSKISNNQPVNNNGYSVLVAGHGSGLHGTWIRQPFASDTDLTGYSNSINYYRGSVNLGSGTVIDSNGAFLYNASTDGSGILQDVVLANRGNNAFFYCINDSGNINVSRGMPIGSGESVNLDNSLVRSIWAVCNNGQTTTVSLSAIRAYNPNTV